MPVWVSFSPGRVHRPRDAEVGHQGVAVLEQDVLGLDVAVDDAVLVGVGQRFRGLAGDLDRVVEGKLLLPVQAVPQGLALDERHDVVEDAVRLARVVQAEDVGVLQVGGDPDLAEEAVGADGGGELGPQDLDRDLAAVRADPVARIDRGHAAFADQSLDLVSVAERGAKLFQDVCHELPREGEEGRTLQR